MRSLTRILRFTGTLWRYYLGVVASATVVAVTALAVPFVIGRATDVAVAGLHVPGHHITAIVWLALVLLGLDLLNSVTTNVNGWLGDVMSARMRQILSSRYFSKLLSLPQSWFDEELTGAITSRLSRSISNVTDFAKAFANNFFTLLLTTAAVLVISAWYYWPLTVLLGIVFPAYVWLTALTSRHWQARQQVINEHIDDAGGRFQEVISQIRVVKSFVTERAEQRGFDAHYDATVATTKEQSTHWHLMDTLRRAVLDGVGFQIGRGERLALVGESGGGKSTIVNLLLGLYPPTEGQILVGGRPTSQVPVDELRRSIGVVFQDPSLFSGTIRENIAYGAGDRVSDEQVLDAARKAFADRFVRRFPDGYETLVGERGIKLSGGQKQRISIARAILKDAPILVLDEATSALDTKSERWVQAGLESLMAGRTSLIIAHRLSTISSVDRIVTLDQGRVDEVGTPDELATSGGIYAELLDLQAAGSRADRKRLARFGIRM